MLLETTNAMRTFIVHIILLFIGTGTTNAFDGFEPIGVVPIIYNDHIRFPYVISDTPETNRVADKINERLQNIIFNGEEIINGGNLHLIEEHLFIQNDSIDQSGISSLNYQFKFYPRFLKLIIDIDWAGGPYPVGAETDNLHFDLKTGELVLMPDVISGTSYFDFLREFWLEECATSIKEAHQCAYGNETDNYESVQAYTLEGPCEFQCHKLTYEFELSSDSILIKNNSNCFPHAWRNCNYGASKYIKINSIREYLSDYGRWLFGLEGEHQPVEKSFHFVGKIDHKYNVSMTLVSAEKNEVTGSYFYWSQNKKIILKGQKTSSRLIVLEEFAEDSNTGSFELEWDDFLYSTDGLWYNKSRDAKLEVELMNIYDYRDREYTR